MIRRSPCEYYTKYLLVHPDGHTLEQVRDILKRQQLDHIGESYLTRLRDSLAIPAPFYPYDLSHTRSQRFLFRERLDALFNPDDDMRAATELLGMPRIKEQIETLLLGGSQPSWIASAIRHQGVSVTPTAVKRYKFYYWNVDLVDSTELRALLHLRNNTLDASEVRDPELVAHGAAMVQASYNDPRVSTANMAVRPLASLFNMMRMGYMPSNVEISRIAAATRNAATARAMEAAIRGGHKDHERGRDWSIVAKAMSEMLEAVGSPEEDFQKELNAITLKTEESEVPHIAELSDGDYTEDLLPLRDTIDVDSE